MASATVALLLVTGCGPLMPGDRYVATGPARTFALSSGTSDANFSCPTAPNVLEEYDDDLLDTGKFSVCTSRSTIYTVRIHGQTKSGNEICVFPAQYIDSNHLISKLDSRGYPMVTCASTESIAAGTTGIVMNFENTNFNAAFIVERQYRDAMQMCLFSSSPHSCPEYSYGKFR